MYDIVRLCNSILFIDFLLLACLFSSVRFLYFLILFRSFYCLQCAHFHFIYFLFLFLFRFLAVVTLSALIECRLVKNIVEQYILCCQTIICWNDWMHVMYCTTHIIQTRDTNNLSTICSIGAQQHTRFVCFNLTAIIYFTLSVSTEYVSMCVCWMCMYRLNRNWHSYIMYLFKQFYFSCSDKKHSKWCNLNAKRLRFHSDCDIYLDTHKHFSVEFWISDLNSGNSFVWFAYQNEIVAEEN